MNSHPEQRKGHLPPRVPSGERKSRPTGAAPSNVGSSGALIAANAENGVAIFTGYDLRPGAVRSARVTIANAGPVSGRFRLLESHASNTFAADDLRLVVNELGGLRLSVLYRGDVGAMPADGLDLGSFEPGEVRTYRFIVALAIDSPNGGQGRGAGAAYEWSLAPAGQRSARAA